MAAFIDNRIWTSLEHNGIHTFKSSPEVTRLISPQSPLLFESSSEDEEEKFNYKDLITEVELSIFDPRDDGTSDRWIKRNATLVRLTGKHPFNSEPPLNRLMQHGFITPVPLHYVRNHGSVPKAQWEDWTVEVLGLVKRPARFTMDQLVHDFPSREFPVTLVCAGNRRKEQNMVKKSNGFNWGAAAISTSVWRGVPLRSVLERCGIYSRTKGALHVCFEGAEELLGGGGSKYGTCIMREVALDPTHDVILAYMQNGELLSPDHGFPVRIIIPGFIGGRMVKWLKRIIVTPLQSDSYYHYNDNRVLPSHVDAELANAQAWWYKPEYIINELNINSVITTPGHDEILPINSYTTQMPYLLRGYAYSGGGRKVTRVEVTVDSGETWRVCTLDHQEKPNKYGKYWCWCFWSLEVEVLDLLGIVFEHPTQPGNQSGGWMAKERHVEKSSESNPVLKKSLSSPFMNTSTKIYTMSEVKKHSNVDSAWIVVHGHVYDCTKFVKDHPGGTDSILINAGTDCTEEFEAIHSDKAKKMIEEYRIGELITTTYTPDLSPDNSIHGNSDRNYLPPIKEVTVSLLRSVALNPREKIPCKLLFKKSISHDVRLFRFVLPSEEQLLGLPVGKHIFLCATIDEKLCMRAYTPTSSGDEVGYFDLVVKVYLKGVHPKFPNGGLMSQYLNSLPIGSVLDVKGPLGHIEYTGRGNFLVNGKHKFAKKLAMLAGGTGITPIYQVVQAILKDPEDLTEMHVVYANRTEDDILLRDELDAWAQKHDQFKVWYVVQESKREGWEYSVGFITEGILKEHLPHASHDTLALACGPPPMIQFSVQPNLEKFGYDIKNNLLLF